MGNEGWLPIESAPRDGTEILLSRGDRVTYGHWLVDEGGIHEHRDLEGNWIGQDESDGFELWMSWDGGFTEEEPPTHWQPKPASVDAELRTLNTSKQAAASEGDVADRARAVTGLSPECRDCFGHGVLLDAGIPCPRCNATGLASAEDR